MVADIFHQKKPPTQRLKTTKFYFSTTLTTNQKLRYRLKALLLVRWGTGTTLVDPGMPQASREYYPVKTRSGFWSEVFCEFAKIVLITCNK